MRCDGCGITVADGTRGCRALFEELLALEFGDFRYGRLHRTMVDTYALQHPDAYCASAKSFAAHLAGLCCAFEHQRDPSVYRAIQQWLSGPSPVDKPVLPEFRGAITIADVHDRSDPGAYLDAVERWARSTWDAHAALHDVARAWVRAALSRRGASARSNA